jgi:hypothetical protein
MPRSNFSNSIARRFVLVVGLFVATACQSPTSPSRSTLTPSDAQFAASGAQQATNVAVSVPNVPFGQAATVTVQVYTDHAISGKKISLTIDNGAPMTGVSGRVGFVTFTVKGLAAGSHTAVAQFAGDREYAAASASTSFSVTAP